MVRLLVLLVGLAGLVQIAVAMRGERAPEAPSNQAVMASPAGEVLPETVANTRDVLAMLGNPSEFRRLHAQIKPARTEAHWKQIPWLSSVWKARQQAAREGKPILLWCMDGSPLGST